MGQQEDLQRIASLSVCPLTAAGFEDFSLGIQTLFNRPGELFKEYLFNGRWNPGEERIFRTQRNNPKRKQVCIFFDEGLPLALSASEGKEPTYQFAFDERNGLYLSRTTNAKADTFPQQLFYLRQT